MAEMLNTARNIEIIKSIATYVINYVMGIFAGNIQMQRIDLLDMVQDNLLVCQELKEGIECGNYMKLFQDYFNCKFNIGDKVVFTKYYFSLDGGVTKRPLYCIVASIDDDKLILKIPYSRDVETNIDNPDLRKANLLELLCNQF